MAQIDGRKSDSTARGRERSAVDAGGEESRRERTPYVSPRLSSFGSIRELTRLDLAAASDAIAGSADSG